MSPERTDAEKYNNSLFKRQVDILVSVLGLPLVVVVIALIGIAIKIEDDGPIFFKQPRIGRGGVPFEMYKLRTFDREGKKKTKVGEVIRPLALDELPQILNILKGDMSLFGVRALPKEIMDRLIVTYREDPDHDEGFIQEWLVAYYSARPGGHSLAVAKGTSLTQREYTTPEAVKEKMLNDIEQVRTASLRNELKILGMMVRKVLKK